MTIFYYQHNKNIEINSQTFQYVQEYKRQLINNITQLLNEIDVKFVISHGNLIEYSRGETIYHDDDLDIRFNVDDITKWQHFCNNPINYDRIKNGFFLQKYNLRFDHRFDNIQKQKQNGIQCKLIHFDNKNNIDTFEMDIHGDFVCSVVETNFWMNYNINFYNLKEIEYLNVKTFAPNDKDTHRVLKNQYGESYLIPKIKYSDKFKKLLHDI